MRTVAGFVIVILWLQLPALAQQNGYIEIKGNVIDSTTSTSLEAATVSAFSSTDSILIAQTLTDKKGAFVLQHIPQNASIRLLISFTGLQSSSMELITLRNSKELIIPTIRLGRLLEQMPEVMVTALRPPIIIKKDTLEYNAAAFKTAPNSVVEDLLRQLPGVEVDAAGNITVNGQRVTKITINGKDFFEGNTTLTTKNFPRDAIDKIQVVDVKSRNERFTGIRPANRDKELNLVLKKDSKRSIFGLASALYGTSDRHRGNASINRFDNKVQLAMIGYSNNTGNQYGENNSSGIPRLAGLGINLNTSFSSKLKLTSQYFLGINKFQSGTSLYRLNLLPDTIFRYAASNSSRNNNNSQYISTTLEWKPDSTTEVYLTSNFGISRNKGSNILTASNSSLQGNIIDTFNTAQQSINEQNNYNLEAFIGKKMGTKGRTLLYNASLTGNIIDENSYNYSETGRPMLGLLSQIIDQHSHRTGTGNSFLFRLTWLEPFLFKTTIRLSHSFSQTRSINDQITHSRDTMGKYSLPSAEYSNLFNNRTQLNIASLFLDYQSKDINLSVGANIQNQNISNFSGNTELPNQHYINIIPNANANIDLQKAGNLSMNYSGFTTPPNITQLQPLPDISNILYQRHGNPGLKPSFSHILSISHSLTKAATFWTSSLSLQTTRNLISDEIWYDSVQHIMPVNTNGNRSVTLNTLFTKTLKKGDFSLRATLMAMGTYAKNTSIANEGQNKTTFRIFSPQVNFFLSYKNLFTIQPTYRGSIMNTRYSLGNYRLQKNILHIFIVLAQLNLGSRFTLDANFRRSTNPTVSTGMPRCVNLLNGTLTYKLDAKQRWTLQLSATDILGQNKNIQRTVGATYTEDQQTITLQRYFLLGLRWNIKRS